MGIAATLATACASDPSSSDGTEDGDASESPTSASSVGSDGGSVDGSADGSSSMTGSADASAGSSSDDGDSATTVDPPEPTCPGWVGDLAGTGWNELPETSFLAWAEAGGIPPGAYQGTGPLTAMVDDYGAPTLDPATNKLYLYNGGHAGGTCNAVVAFDAAALEYSLAIPPTPPTSYPPSYVNGGSDQPGPLVYPSGFTTGFFEDATTLVAAEDLPYAAPMRARPASHTYSATGIHDSTLTIHYLNVADADLSRGAWTYTEQNPYGPQLAAIAPEYGGEFPLQSGTKGVSDAVGGFDWITLVPGDEGINWRNGLMKIDPATHTIAEIVAVEGMQMGISTSLCIDERYVWAFTPTGDYPGPFAQDRAWRIDMDTSEVQTLRLQGDVPQFDLEGSMEAMPCFSDGTGVASWNYETERDVLYRIDRTPTAGTGTPDDPFVMSQTRVDLDASSMPDPRFQYRVNVLENCGVAMVLPHASSNWWALRLP